ncbi:MAG: hypothetical protein AAFP02_18685, partial [Bacteroidota bacterium]
MKNLLLFLFQFFLFSAYAQTPTLEIHQIQGTGPESSYIGQRVKVEGKQVTWVGEDRFFIQTVKGQEDDDPATSEGMLVYTKDAPRVNVNDIVSITGTIGEFRGQTEFVDQSLNVQVTGTAAAIEDFAALTPTLPDNMADMVEELEAYEGMLVSLETGTVVGPATGSSQSFAVQLDLAASRPFREPGIQFPGVSNLPLWDGNPEVLIINQFELANKAAVSTGMTIGPVQGVLYERNRRYYIYPLTTVSINSGSEVEQAARDKKGSEYSVASLNALRLFSSDSQQRFNDFARYIADKMDSPDIVALQEVGRNGALDKLANALNQTQSKVDYEAYIMEVTNSDIQLGFLVNKAFSNIKVTLLGANEILSTGNRLHDRPPALLELNLNNNAGTKLQLL